MGQPTWGRNETIVRVPDREGSTWTLALDWLTPGKLYRIEVRSVAEAPPSGDPEAPKPAPAPLPAEEQKWTPFGASQACTADGDTTGLSRREPLLIPEARLGALIAKVGGGTADIVVDKAATLLFPVGRYCVFKAPEDPKTGPLFLAMNDSPASAGQATASLHVVITEAL